MIVQRRKYVVLFWIVFLRNSLDDPWHTSTARRGNWASFAARQQLGRRTVCFLYGRKRSCRSRKTTFCRDVLHFICICRHCGVDLLNSCIAGCRYDFVTWFAKISYDWPPTLGTAF